MRNPWLDLPERPPFVLPQDAQAVEAHNNKVPDQYRFRTGALPEPFLGAADGKVVFLNLNPGYAPGIEEVHADPAFSSALRATLRHEDSPHPMYLLDPRFAATGGGKWWRMRLRVLAEAVGGYDVVGRGLLVLEAIAYPSTSFKRPSMPLPSTDYVVHLARQAMAEERPLVLMRAKWLWEELLPELSSYPRRYEYNSPQSTYCTPKNCPAGFDDIAAALTA